MSWGIKILILYLSFVTLILTLVITSFGHKTDLEYKDYYAREIRFQDQIDARNNTLALSSPIACAVTERDISLSFPEELKHETLLCRIEFLRPSDAALDREVKLMAENGSVRISTADLSLGYYKMKITFTWQGKNYFQETGIRIK